MNIDFDEVNRKALPYINEILHELLPDGEFRGKQCVALNPTRVDKHKGSFTFDIEKGIWKDFSSGEGGGDIISLWAYVKRLSQKEAAMEITKRFNMDPQKASSNSSKPTNTYKPIIPVPENAPKPTFKRYYTDEDIKGIKEKLRVLKNLKKSAM